MQITSPTTSWRVIILWFHFLNKEISKLISVNVKNAQVYRIKIHILQTFLWWLLHLDSFKTKLYLDSFKTKLFWILFYFIFWYSRYLLVLYFIHISVYMSIPISQFIPLPTHTLLSPLGVHTFVLYICVSISAMQTDSSLNDG